MSRPAAARPRRRAPRSRSSEDLVVTYRTGRPEDHRATLERLADVLVEILAEDE